MTRWLQILSARLRGLFHGDAIAEEIRDELRFHIDMRIEEYERRGLAPEAARRQARRRVGNLALHQDRGYDVRGGGVMETIVQDVRYSVRLLLKQRGFAAVAIVTLALAIGAMTAVVSVIDAAMLRPLPYPDPEQLVSVTTVTVTQPDGREMRMGPSVYDLRGWLAFDDVFSAATAWRRRFHGRIVDGERPERVEVVEATEGFLATYGLVPLHGRDFNREDMFEGAPPVVMLGYGYWQSRYGGDPAVIGEVIHMSDESATIVGVLPPTTWVTELLAPLRMPAERQAARSQGLSFNARLTPGMTTERAAERLLARLDDLTPADGALQPQAVSMSSLLERTTERHWTTVAILTGAVVLVLLLACVNVAGLQLARAATRAPEFALRASLGAGRRRLVRQVLTESLLLALTGAVAGVLIAWLALDALVANLPIDLPSNAPVTINLTVLLIGIVVTLATTMLFGLVPALRLSRAATGRALGVAGRRVGSGLSRRGSQALIVAEVALAVVLVVGAALMLRSFARVMSVDVGFDPESIVTMEVVPLDANPAMQAAFYPALLRSLRLIPGIESAGAVDFLPLGGVSMVGSATVEGEGSMVGILQALPGYVEALALPLIAGRTLREEDLRAGANGAMINEAAARTLFPGGSALGRSFATPSVDDAGNRIDLTWEVIGVIGDVLDTPFGEPEPGVVLPFRPNPLAAEQQRGLAVILRPNDDIPDLANRLREAAEGVGPRVLVESVRSGGDWLGDRVVTPRRRTVLLSLLGGLGLLLALVGVFGLTAYAVARRTQEIGVRMTFGARPGHVVGTIVQDSAVPVFGGIAIGLAAAVMATRVIESFLFETAPTDPTTFAAVAAVLAITGCLAAWIPARRAVRIDPAIALRAE